MKLWKRSKYELYISILVVFVPPLMVRTNHTITFPLGYGQVLLTLACLLIGFIGLYGALADIKHMNWLERMVAIVWLFLLLTFTWQFIYGSFINRR